MTRNNYRKYSEVARKFDWRVHGEQCEVIQEANDLVSGLPNKRLIDKLSHLHGRHQVTRGHAMASPTPGNSGTPSLFSRTWIFIIIEHLMTICDVRLTGPVCHFLGATTEERFPNLCRSIKIGCTLPITVVAVREMFKHCADLETDYDH